MKLYLKILLALWACIYVAAIALFIHDLLSLTSFILLTLGFICFIGFFAYQLRDKKA